MERVKWYKKSWIMWVLLIFLPPVGIILMWATKREYATKKKTILSVVFALWFFLILGIENSSPKDTGNGQATTEETTTQEKSTAEKETRISLKDSDSLEEYLSTLTEGAKKNSSAMVDKIASIAKEDAMTATDEQLNDAVTFIAENYPNYHSNDNIMEATMYYGYLLDYAYDDNDPESMLGVDAYEVVKYVYRKTENTENDATKENLRQIKKDLEALGIEVATEEESTKSKKELEESQKESSIAASKAEESKKAAEESSIIESSIQASIAESSVQASAAQVSIEQSQQASIAQAQTPAPVGTNYVLNTNTHKFHYPSCRDVGRIAPQNYADFTGTRDAVIAQGYSPCGHCHP